MSRSLGSLTIDLVANTATMQKNFKDAEGTVSKFGSTAAKVGTVATSAFGKLSGAFSAIKNALFSIESVMSGVVLAIGGGVLAHSFHEAAKAVDDLGKKSRVFGLSVEQMSALRFTAEESGVEFETLAKLVGRATKGFGEFVRTGGGPAASAIRDLELNVKNAAGQMRPMADLLPEIGTAFEKIADEGQRLSLATAIFGRDGGAQFVQWLEDSGGFMQNLADQTERAGKLGVIFNETQFQKLKAYSDAVGRIGEAWLGVRVRLMTEVAPALTELANRAALLLAKVGNFAANLASVLSAAFNAESSGAMDLGDGTEFAANYLKESARRVLEMLWTEVWTRVADFSNRLWAFVKILLKEFLGKIGDWIGGAAEGLTGFIGEALKPVFTLIGEGISLLAEGIGSAAIEYADMWEQATRETAAYSKELEETRRIAMSWVTLSIDGINRMGEEYRGLRDAAAGYGEQVKKNRDASIATNWEQFFAGMKRGWQDLKQQANDFAGLGEKVFTTMSDGLSGGLASALADGSASFKNFGQTALKVLEDVGQSIAQMLIKFALMRAIESAASGIFTSAPTAPSSLGNTANFGPTPPTYAAKGGVFGFANGGVASGVLSGPTAFNFSKKIGVAGEAGGEVGFAPLRKIGGELGVASTGGAVTVQIIDQRSGGAKAEVTQSKGDDGKKLIRVLIRDEVRRGIGAGDYDRNLGGAFGLSRQGTKR